MLVSCDTWARYIMSFEIHGESSFHVLSYNIFLHHKSSYIFTNLPTSISRLRNFRFLCPWLATMAFLVPRPVAPAPALRGMARMARSGGEVAVPRRHGWWLLNVVNLYDNGLWLVVSKILDVPFHIQNTFFWVVIRNPLTNSYFSEGLKPPTSYGHG